jgi:hypothetical protein
LLHRKCVELESLMKSCRTIGSDQKEGHIR